MGKGGGGASNTDNEWLDVTDGIEIRSSDDWLLKA